MVNDIKYTPILKWKKAEEGAIKDLSNSQKDSILPMFEFIRPTQVSKTAKNLGITNAEDELVRRLSGTIPKDILLSWGDGRLFFADFTLIEPIKTRMKFSNNFIQNSCKLYLEPIPVVNLSADASEYIKNIVTLSIKYLKSNICIRFNKADLIDAGLINKKLSEFCNDYKLAPDSISVFIDLKEDINIGCFEKAMFALKDIETPKNYMNIIIASGAFPEDMSKITTEDDRRDRIDWYNWSHNKSKWYNLLRYPAFADYTVRHPIYNEKAEHYRATATIKYTLDTEWRFFKGQVGKYEMCLAYASALREDRDFLGRDYSAGDKYIDDKGLYYYEYVREVNKNPTKKVEGTGNATQWIRAGINHHIAVVVDQVANLGV